MHLQVNSEIGPLRKILLHKPAEELNNLIPDNMHYLLFDDLPDYHMAGREYDSYLEILHQAGVETYFIEDLVAEALDQCDGREAFLHTFLGAHACFDEAEIEHLAQYFLAEKDNHKLVKQLIAGLRREDHPELGEKISPHAAIGDSFLLNPLPNLFFTRDFMTVMGDTVSLNLMQSPARAPETVLARWFFRHHPDFKDVVIHDLNDAADPEACRIEGGDIIVLNEETIIVGISQRTGEQGVAYLAQKLFEKGGVRNLQYVIGLEIPSKRAFMHLDTVFTQVDRDCFVVHPCVQGKMKIIEFTRDKAPQHREGRLEELLAHYMGCDKVRLVRCGGDSAIDGEREQWNDGSNTLAIKPGEVIVYTRNPVTNKLLEEAGITLRPINVSELARGRGGPHCMSQPLFRDFL